MGRTLPLVLLSLSACNNDSVDEYDNNDLSGQQADVFHVGARYRIASVKTENTALSLEGEATTDFVALLETLGGKNADYELGEIA